MAAHRLARRANALALLDGGHLPDPTNIATADFRETDLPCIDCKPVTLANAELYGPRFEDAMTLASMTGFARASGADAPYRWVWEIKTVNAKGLDLRLRLPSGFDAIEAPARARLGAALSRGTCYATLSIQRDAAPAAVRVNQDVLASLIAALQAMPLDAQKIRPASLDGLLGVRGVVEVVEAGEDEGALAAAQAGALAGLERAITELVAMRQGEGAALQALLDERLTQIARLTAAADASPARGADAIRARLQQTLALLIGGTSQLDPQRLHQEAVLMAAKADIREELDRLHAHVSATRALLLQGGAIGRRLDFLAQEFSREANTLCAKSNDVSLTAQGLELRAEIEQLREQVQNIE